MSVSISFSVSRTPRIVILVGVCLVLVSGPGTTADKQEPSKPKPVLIRVSLETTFLKGPLRKDGFVDYAAALNARASRGVTPKTNAAALFAQTLGPDRFPKSIRKQFFAKLGIPVPPPEGRYFLSMSQFAEQQAVKNDGSYADDLYKQQGKGADEPWARNDLPKLAAWLEFNQKPLSAVLRATQREAYYWPLVFGGGDDDNDRILMAASLPLLDELRDFARALWARAMLAVHEGRLADAQHDLLACHRLARLAAKGPTSIDSLLGYAVESNACAADVGMLRSGRLSKEQLAKFQQAIEKLPPLPSSAEKINLFERLSTLDAVGPIARQGFKGNETVLPLVVLLLGDTPLLETLKRFYGDLDWNVVMQTINAEYDRMHAAMRKPSHVERRKAFDAYEQHLVQHRTQLYDAEQNKKLFVGGTIDRTKLSELMGNLIVGLLTPALPQVREAEDKGVTRLRLIQVAVALERERQATGRFPRGLDAVKPRFRKGIPGDLYSQKEFVYRPMQGGYLLYSVGANGRDDRGQTFDSSPPGDDIAVRMILTR